MTYLQQLNANDPVRSEFAEIFSRFGSVSHAVILATVDNASRRRGFIVMSYHHEAKAAMDALNRKEIKQVIRLIHLPSLTVSSFRGHVIDVSWAVVQRSEGVSSISPTHMALSLTFYRLPRWW